MARKRGGRRRNTNWSRYIAGNIDKDIVLATLAAKTALRSVTAGIVVDTTKISSIRCTYSLSGITPADNKGPILVGCAHPDYSLTEIEQWIELDSSWNLGDMIGREVRQRKIRLIGVFDMPTVDGGSSRLNDGLPVKTKLNWVITEDDGLAFWVYNLGTVALDGSANVNIFGKANLWYQ